MRIGIFGGSFDPIHIGHLALVVELMEKHCLEHVYIIPAKRSPHKMTNGSVVEDRERLYLVQLAFQNLKNVSVLDIELQRDPPSYTIDTIQQMYEKKFLQKEDKIFILLGEDQIESFHTWKDVKTLCEKTELLIATRTAEVGRSYQEQQVPEYIQKAIMKGYSKTHCFDISSTTIRLRIKNGLFCGHLLPESVYSYILAKGLYT